METIKEPETVELRLKAIVKKHVTHEDGNIVFTKINKELAKGNKVIINMTSVPGLNTSFVNSAFVQLLNCYPYETVKRQLHFINTNKQINNIIKNSFKTWNNKSQGG